MYDGPPDGLSAEVLTQIYGEEDWEATIRNVDDDDMESDRPLEDHPVPEIDHDRMAGMT